MREIKFRGRRGYDGKWLYGNLIIDFANRKYIVPFEYFGLDGHHLVYEDHTDEPVFIDEETIGEYTGLKDKNGKEIYEGDIVFSKGWNSHSYEVVFDRGEYCLKRGEDSNYYPDIKYAEQMKVIGSIHENPDLIKRENK